MDPTQRTSTGPEGDASRRRLPVPASVLAPIVVLVVVVALGAAGRLMARGPGPNGTEAGQPVRESTEPDGPSPEATTALAFADGIAGIPVLSVGEALEQVRAQPRGTLIAVRGWVTAPQESRTCETLPGRPQPTWTLLCWRGAILSGDGDPLLAVDGTPLRLGDPGPQLSGDVMPGTSIAPSLTERVGGRRVLRPTPAIVLGRLLDRQALECDEGASCARTFAIERVLGPDGSTDDRITRRDPDLGFSTLPRADLLAAIDSVVPRSPVVLREVFVDRSDLAYVDAVAAAAASAGATGTGVWFITAVADVSEPSAIVTWLVVDDATGAVLASAST